MTYRAVIFDMDGVLADSEPAFFDAVNLTLESTGKQVAWDAYQRLLGTSVEVTWTEVLKMLALPIEIDAYLPRFNEVLLDCLRQPRAPLPGVIAVIDELDRRNVPFAVATSSIRPWFDAVMESVGLTGRFAVSVTADMIQHPKPAPEIYLRAAELLGVPPFTCIAVEDTIPGVASAKAAAMYAIHVMASSTALPPIRESDRVIETLLEFPFQLVGKV